MSAKIDFSKAEKEALVRKIKMYFAEELDQEIGSFDAEFLLDFFTEEVGAYFYNRGLYDARELISQQLENLDDAIFAIEQPTEFAR